MSDSIKKYYEMNEFDRLTAQQDSLRKDSVVESIKNQFDKRSTLGIKKYGTTLSENELSLTEWMEHLKQELMDAILYIERSKDEIRNGKSSLQQDPRTWRISFSKLIHDEPTFKVSARGLLLLC